MWLYIKKLLRKLENNPKLRIYTNTTNGLFVAFGYHL